MLWITLPSSSHWTGTAASRASRAISRMAWWPPAFAGEMRRQPMALRYTQALETLLLVYSAPIVADDITPTPPPAAWAAAAVPGGWSRGPAPAVPTLDACPGGVAGGRA